MTLETQELRAVLPGVGLTQCCSTGLTARAEGKRAQGYLCHFLVPSCGCPPTREVTEVKKKKKIFLQTSCGDALSSSAPASAPRFLSSSVQLPPCALCSSLCHPHCTDPVTHCVCCVGLCSCLGSFLASGMDVANKSWGLSILSSCTTFNAVFLLQPLI